MKSRHRHSHFKRYLRIAEILARHGLGYVATILGLEHLLPFSRYWARHSHTRATTRPEHIRQVLEELGATAIKIGQIISTRADLLSPAYQAELAKLQDNAPPVPAVLIRDVITRELGRPVDELFAYFDPVPIAAASIGQAHAAILPDGSYVVVKVRRPGVVKQIDEDLEIFQDLAKAAAKRWEAAKDYDVVGLAREFADTLLTELDYVREGHSAERIAENFAGDERIHIPRIYWELTTSRVLVMEQVGGINVTDLEALVAAGIDLRQLAARAANLILKMVFEDGFFHADPHPGNLFVQKDGSIAFIDFGMVGSVDEDTRKRTVVLIDAISSKDHDRLVDAFIDLGVTRQRVDRPALRQDLVKLGADYIDRPIGEIKLGAFLTESFAVVRRHHIQIPTSLALILKMGIMVEGIGARLDPTFNLMNAIKPHGERLMRQRYAPGPLAHRLGRAGLDSLELGMELPMQTKRLLKELERGNIEIRAKPIGMEPILERLEQLINRLVLALIASAFIIALAVLLQVYHPPGWQAFVGSLLGVAFVLAAVLGIYLAWTIASPRHKS